MIDTSAESTAFSEITDGEFKGWLTLPHSPFEQVFGPFAHRAEPDGSILCAFRPGPSHCNGVKAVHGGAIMAFADFCLFSVAIPARDMGPPIQPVVTVSLNVEMTGPAFPGERMEGRGEVVRAGGSMLFVRGLIEQQGRPVAAFSGVLKKMNRERLMQSR